MKLQWTLEAIRDLVSIKGVIGRSRPRVANKVIRHIKASTNLLAAQPLLGRVGRIQGTREWIIAGLPYLIPYMLRGETVVILRVLHTSMDWEDPKGR